MAMCLAVHGHGCQGLGWPCAWLDIGWAGHGIGWPWTALPKFWHLDIFDTLKTENFLNLDLPIPVIITFSATGGQALPRALD
jgi:hypothetical protein